MWATWSLRKVVHISISRETHQAILNGYFYRKRFALPGCAFLVPASMYSQEIELEWAKNQVAFLVETEREMFIVVRDSRTSFQYLIFPEGSMEATLEFLKSMKPVSE